MRFPVGPHRITTKFSTSHPGLDIAPLIAGTRGVEIFSPEPSVVVSSSYRSSPEGHYIILQGRDTGHFYYFGHFEKRLVSVGQSIGEGQVIGIMGWTGKVIPKNVNGTHTHHEVRTKKNSTFSGYKQLDPLVWYKGESMDKETIRNMYVGMTNTEPTAEQMDYWSGSSRTAKELAKALRDGGINLNMRYRADNIDGGYPFLKTEVKRLNTLLDTEKVISKNQAEEIKKLQAEGGTYEKVEVYVKR